MSILTCQTSGVPTSDVTTVLTRAARDDAGRRFSSELRERCLRVSPRVRARLTSIRASPSRRASNGPPRPPATGGADLTASTHAATGEVTAPHLRRVVSEEDIEAAELMCSLRDVVDTPPTSEETVGLVPEPRATTRISPTPTTESRGRRGKHPAKKNNPKSLVDPRGGGGGGRVESLLTRARGIERQLTPRIPARYGSITEALAYIDAQPPADIELESSTSGKVFGGRRKGGDASRSRITTLAAMQIHRKTTHHPEALPLPGRRARFIRHPEAVAAGHADGDAARAQAPRVRARVPGAQR